MSLEEVKVNYKRIILRVGGVLLGLSALFCLYLSYFLPKKAQTATVAFLSDILTRVTLFKSNMMPALRRFTDISDYVQFSFDIQFIYSLIWCVLVVFCWIALALMSDLARKILILLSILQIYNFLSPVFKNFSYSQQFLNQIMRILGAHPLTWTFPLAYIVIFSLPTIKRQYK